MKLSKLYYIITERLINRVRSAEHAKTACEARALAVSSGRQLNFRNQSISLSSPAFPLKVKPLPLPLLPTPISTRLGHVRQSTIHQQQWAHFSHAEVLFLLKLKLPQKIPAQIFEGISQATLCGIMSPPAQRQKVGSFPLKGKEQHSLLNLTWDLLMFELEPYTMGTLKP